MINSITVKLNISQKYYIAKEFREPKVAKIFNLLGDESAIDDLRLEPLESLNGDGV